MQISIRNFITILFAFSISGCKQEAEKHDLTSEKEAIRTAEKDFEKMVGEKGIAEAFWFFADSSATIKRQNDTLIHGRDNIKNYYSAESFKMASVTWSPDFIDVSENADMGYTYGNYKWKVSDSTGKSSEYNGVFHTVWKKQKDGSWKYVWD